MKRREFLGATAAFLGGLAVFKQVQAEPPKVTAKDVLREGQPATIPNYCEQPDKQPNKYCPTKPAGKCDTCRFYNHDKSETTFEGKKVARCQLLTDPKKPQFVFSTASCSTYVKNA